MIEVRVIVSVPVDASPVATLYRWLGQAFQRIPLPEGTTIHSVTVESTDA